MDQLFGLQHRSRTVPVILATQVCDNLYHPMVSLRLGASLWMGVSVTYRQKVTFYRRNPNCHLPELPSARETSSNCLSKRMASKCFYLVFICQFGFYGYLCTQMIELWLTSSLGSWSRLVGRYVILDIPSLMADGSSGRWQLGFWRL